MHDILSFPKDIVVFVLKHIIHPTTVKQINGFFNKQKISETLSYKSKQQEDSSEILNAEIV